MVALYTLFYRFVRTHSKLRITPAMQAEIATTFTRLEAMAARSDAAQAPRVRGRYKQRVA